MLGAMTPVELIQDYIANKNLIAAHELADSMGKNKDIAGECILWDYHL